MAFRDFAEQILRGGLPAVLDNPGAPRTQQGDTAPERTPPTQTVADNEPFLAGVKNVLTPERVITFAAILVGIGVIVWVARRA